MAVKPVQSVERALGVLEAVAEHQPIGVGELARALARDKSAVQRALVTLHAAGWIQAVAGEPTRWELSTRPLVVAAHALPRLGLRERGRVALESLRDETGETGLLAVLDVHRVVIVDVAESRQMLRTAPPVGLATPTDTGALGRAMLAYVPTDELERMPGIRIDRGLLDELAAVRRRGWSQKARDLAPGTVSLGAPILDGARPVGALGITGPAARLPAAARARAGLLLAAAASSLSQHDDPVA